MSQHDGKIFGIGFYKTGTTTLYDALRLLGYSTVNGDKPGSYPGADDGATLVRQIDAGDYRLPTFDMFDAFTDNPYFRIWRRIYDMYPDAKYILTVRDEARWIASCAKFFRHRRVRPMRVWMFGAHANPGRDAAVREFFATRQHQYFEFDPTREGGWEPLCAFLGAPVPDRPWPHANPTKPDSPWRPAWRRLRQALGLEAREPVDGDAGD